MLYRLVCRGIIRMFSSTSNTSLTGKPEITSFSSLQSEHAKISSLSDAELEIFLAEFNKTIQLEPELNFALLSLVMGRISSYKLTPNSAQIIKFFSILHNSTNFLQVDSASHLLEVSKKISKSSLNSFSLKFISDILSAFSKIYKNTEKVPTMNGKDLYMLSQDVILEKLQTFEKSQAQDCAAILTTYLKLKKGLDPFLLVLEAKVFGNLKEINAWELIDLLKLYEIRRISDYHYITEAVLKPSCEAILSSIEKLEFEVLSEYIKVVMKECGRYGVYHSPEIEAKLIHLVFNKLPYLVMPSSVKTTLCVRILAYSHLTNFLDDRLALMIYKIVFPELPSIKPNRYYLLGFYFARFSIIPDAFWKFCVKGPISLETEDPKMISVVFMMLQLLKATKPFIQSRIYKSLSQQFVEGMRPKLQELRKIEVKAHKKAIEQVLAAEALSKLGVEFEEEYFDVFAIDLALPGKRIGFEMCGPNHYVWPSQALNGITKAKQSFLEKQGWKIYIIKFNAQLSNKLRTDEIKQEIIQIFELNRIPYNKNQI